MSSQNKNTALSVLAIIVGMFCLAFASVPLYSLFCKVTGYGGTPKIVEDLPDQIGHKDYQVFFNADTAKGLPWQFKPLKRSIITKAGKHNLIFYEATNLGDKPVTGTATYNITPLKAGGYFSKIECFCFTKQILQPGQTITFPVSFYIDPEIENDPYLKDATQLTLSYTFFEAVDDNIKK